MFEYYTSQLRAKFDARWTEDPETGCWVWHGTINNRGYGRFYIFGNYHRGANRVSLEFQLGRLLERHEWALHNCPGTNNKRCVNPAHLYVGTHADNVRDALERGEYPRGDASAPRRHPESARRGELNHCARLTAAQVVDIRARYAAGEHQIPMAAEFGITQAAISAIITRKNWKHL